MATFSMEMPPQLTGDERRDLAQLRQYLARLIDRLLYTLNHLDSENMVEGGVSIRSISGAGADILEAAVAELGQANIGKATVQHLNAQVAEIVTAVIRTAVIDWGSIARLEAAYVKTAQLEAYKAVLADATIGSATIDWAHMNHLDANQAIVARFLGGRMYIDRLAVNGAQVLDLTVQNLVIKASDGKYYRLDINPDPSAAGYGVTCEEVTVTAGEIAAGVTSSGKTIIETDLLVSELEARNITAIEALIDKISARRIDVDQLFAREATLPHIQGAVLEGDFLKLQVGNYTNDPLQEEKGRAMEAEQNLRTELSLREGAIRQTVEERRAALENSVSRVETRATTLEQTAAGFRADIDGINQLYGTHILIDEQAMTLTQNQASGVGAVLTADALRFRRITTDGDGHVTAYGEILAEFGKSGAYADRLRSNETLSVGTQTRGWYDFVSTAGGVSEKWRDGTASVTPLHITEQPEDVNIVLTGSAGDSDHPLDGSSWPESITLSCEAAGAASYKWQHRLPRADAAWTDLPDGIGETRQMTMLTGALMLEESWRCRITDADGREIATRAARIRAESSTGPAIVGPIQDEVSGTLGGTATLRFLPVGGIASYEWQYRDSQDPDGAWVSYTGADNPQSSEKTLTLTHSTEYIRCVVIGTDGSCAVTQDCTVTAA